MNIRQRPDEVATLHAAGLPRTLNILVTRVTEVLHDFAAGLQNSELDLPCDPRQHTPPLQRTAIRGYATVVRR